MKTGKYIISAVFILASLSVVDLMLQTGFNAIPRYQFNYFDNALLYRALGDLLMLGSLIVLLTRHLIQKNNGIVYWVASLT